MAFRNNQFNSIEDVVLSHTKLTRTDYLEPNEIPYIHNLAEAATFIKRFVANNPTERITIVGDYDADGVCASAILNDALARYVWRHGKNRISVRLPKRMSEGYGLSDTIVDEIESGLLITVDNGIAAIEAIKLAKKKGLTVVVTDHHLPVCDESGMPVLPNADIIVDPNAEDRSEYKCYCGAGIAYRLAKELLPNSNLDEMVVIASIATVCDVMEITGANWKLVKDGLSLYNRGAIHPELEQLAEKMQIAGHITEADYGFKIGPVLNAPGRLKDDGATLSFELLKHFNKQKWTKEEISDRTDSLIEMNDVRKGLVREAIDAYTISDGLPIVEYMPNIEEGIAGLIAGQLCEKYHSPCIVFADTAVPEKLKGSGRSIPEVNLKKLLDEMTDERILYGGHASAVGISIEKSHFDEFRHNFKMTCGAVPERPMETDYDLEIELKDIPEMLAQLKKYAPFGEGNREPRFLIRNLYIPSVRELSSIQGFSLYVNGVKLFAPNLFPKYLELGSPNIMNCVATIGENWYKGRCSVQLTIIDIACGDITENV